MSKQYDLEMAQRIVHQAGSFVGPMGTLRPNIARVVADGIALGRLDGLVLAAKEIETRSAALADRIRKLSNSN